MEKKFKLSSGAPFARCATSNRKKISFDFFFKGSLYARGFFDSTDFRRIFWGGF